MAEVAHSYPDRVADLEAKLARVERELVTARAGRAAREYNYRLALTLGATIAIDSVYETQATNPCRGHRLPVVFLDCNGGASDVTLDVRSQAPYAWAYCPWGWVPRHIEVETIFDGRQYVVVDVPRLAVQLVDTITAPAFGTAKIINHSLGRGDFTANEQEFEVYLEMGDAAAEAGKIAYVELQRGPKRWTIYSLEC